jgi:hypothetical protein
VATAIANLADAIDAQAAGDESGTAPSAGAFTGTEAAPSAFTPVEPLAITPEHRRAVERRLRKAGVLR